MSFPSGHAQNAVVAWGVLLLVFLPVLRGRWRVVAVIAAVAVVLAIGFARVALSVHFVSDVLAGYALGAAWLAAPPGRRCRHKRPRQAGHGGPVGPCHRDATRPRPPSLKGLGMLSARVQSSRSRIRNRVPQYGSPWRTQ